MPISCKTFTVDDVLVAADQELAWRGWTRYRLVDPLGQVCALGALLAGVAKLRGLPAVMAASYEDPLFKGAAEACVAALGAELPPNPYVYHPVALWNNEVAQGAEDVHAMFEKARKLLVES